MLSFPNRDRKECITESGIFGDDTINLYFSHAFHAGVRQVIYRRCAVSEDADPLLVLFEALKWSFRISAHLVIGFLEDSQAQAMEEKKC